MAEDLEIEKEYTREKASSKLRRLADALEHGKPFEIEIAGQRIYVPPTAEIVFEYERGEEEDELEIEIKWTRKTRD